LPHRQWLAPGSWHHRRRSRGYQVWRLGWRRIPPFLGTLAL